MRKIKGEGRGEKKWREADTVMELDVSEVMLRDVEVAVLRMI